MDTLWKDLRFGARTLLKNPAFSVVAVLALALGIGANTLLFSVVHAVLVREPPFPEPSRLVVVWEKNIPRNRDQNVVSPANFMAWRERNQVFEQMAAFIPWEMNLTGGGEPERIKVGLTTPSLFSILGTPAAMGRALVEEDGREGSEDVLVLSDGFWRRRFGADPAILGKTVSLNGEPAEIVGVMPPQFDVPPGVDLWAAFALTERHRTHGGRYLAVLGRLKSSANFEQARLHMLDLATQLQKEHPERQSGWSVNLVPFQEQLSGDLRPALLALLGAVALVLLIGCANVANLLLARGAVRERELAVRTALGAGRGRLFRQLLTESALLALAGGAAGLLLAWLGLGVLPAIIPAEIPRFMRIELNAATLLFTLGVSLVTAMVFGSAPALQASRSDPLESLKEGGRNLLGGRSVLRSLLVVAETAFALALLVGAGLLINSFLRLLDTDPGFNPENVMAVKINLPGSRYDSDSSQVQFFQRLEERLGALPGVESTGSVSWLPMVGLGSATSFRALDRPEPEQGKAPVADVRVVTPGYFQTMQIGLLQGRGFDGRDTDQSPRVVVVNQSMAEAFWPNRNPIGERIEMSWDEPIPAEIVGVVEDVRLTQLDTQARHTLYWAQTQLTNSFMSVTVRSRTPPEALAPSIRAVLREIDPDQPASDIRAMTQVLSDSLKQTRFTVLLLGIFAGLAFFLAVLGIYGVVSYTVNQRTREIGVRMAFGARRMDVLGMILGQGMLRVALGLAAGLALSWVLTRFLSGLLYEVSATDPWTFAVVTLVFVAAAAAASLIPARRATGVDPMEALRYE